MTNYIERVAGMSMRSSRGENISFSLLEHHGDNRWFLTNLLQLKDEQEYGNSIDQAFIDWPKRMNVSHIVFDLPLSLPLCHTCKLLCPGSSKCPVSEVIMIREYSEKILKEDQDLLLQGRKNYENKRILDNEVSINKNVLTKEVQEAILSRSFKRRLKKEFLPYWNRPIDFWIWLNYYDPLLNLFNISYDSFGQTSFMSFSRMQYLRRHIDKNISFYESSIYIVFVEMLRAKLFEQKDLSAINDYILGVDSRYHIIKKIEEGLGIFVYDQDLDILVKDQKSFTSFILSCAGVALSRKKIKELPDWSLSKEGQFLVPFY